MRETLYMKIKHIIFCALLGIAILITGCNSVDKSNEETESKIENSAKEVMIKDIEKELEDSIYRKATDEEAKNIFGGDLFYPQYLPDGFSKHGVFLSDNIKELPMVKIVWFDYEKKEMLMITMGKADATEPNKEEEIVFTDKLEIPGKISDMYSWAEFCTYYKFVQNGVNAQSYMLVNDENNRDEYNKILKSFK